MTSLASAEEVPLLLAWNPPPRNQEQGITGALWLANRGTEELDTTLIVVAVNDQGRAVVLGYQRLRFAGNTRVAEIPFRAGLARGKYTVHADAVGEAPEVRRIYRAHLETAAPIVVE